MIATAALMIAVGCGMFNTSNPERYSTDGKTLLAAMIVDIVAYLSIAGVIAFL